jgi:hypothetical protein
MIANPPSSISFRQGGLRSRGKTVAFLGSKSDVAPQSEVCEGNKVTEKTGQRAVGGFENCIGFPSRNRVYNLRIGKQSGERDRQKTFDGHREGSSIQKSDTRRLLFKISSEANLPAKYLVDLTDLVHYSGFSLGESGSHIHEGSDVYPRDLILALISGTCAPIT